MILKSWHKGSTLKTATFSGASVVSDAVLVQTALTFHGETPSSVFQTYVKRFGNGCATVTIHTD